MGTVIKDKRMKVVETSKDGNAVYEVTDIPENMTILNALEWIGSRRERGLYVIYIHDENTRTSQCFYIRGVPQFDSSDLRGLEKPLEKKVVRIVIQDRGSKIVYHIVVTT